MNKLKLEDVEEMARDLSQFADLGTDAPLVIPENNNASILLTRNGVDTELDVSLTNGTISETVDGEVQKHVSFKALLASDRYGALRTWAARQKAFLSVDNIPGNLIPLWGTLNNNLNKYDLAMVEGHLIRDRHLDSTRILLIDGPAGIGKTQFIANLCRKRAEQYSELRHPLVLHIQSRGRTLSYLYDLMAFSLQRLRVDVTFDQVPVLAKHGLITVAVDGFDELADPDGYGMAWSQVSELVSSVRGDGTIILAGRETFIGRDRLLKDVSSIRIEIDDIAVLTLNPPTKADAITWLRGEGWSDSQLDAVESFLEPGSLALRPFFLKTLSDESIAARISDTTSTNILSMLINAMIEREIGKFGEAVERELSVVDLQVYVSTLMAEVARDMAENSTVAISDATLSWLADVALPKEVSDNVERILKSRAQVVAFLTNDDRPGYRRFYHEKFYEYFLSRVIIETVATEAAIKPVARSLFASSFLETFGAIVSGGTPLEEVSRFLAGALKLSASYVAMDRTKRNMGALLIASLAVADLIDEFSIESVETDEVRFAGTAAASSIRDVVISQFDCRGADLSEVKFNNCVIISLIGDQATVLPASFPMPSRVQDVELGGSNIIQPDEISGWVGAHLRHPPILLEKLIPEGLRDHPAIRLLFRVCRLRQYWLRRGDDVHAAKILDNEYWPLIERMLNDNGLLKVEMRQASGNDARFMHVKNSYEILSEDVGNPDVVRFYRQLMAEIE